MSRKKQVTIDPQHFEACFKVIDAHTQGEFTRIVYDGFPEPQGNTMLEKKQYVSENYDHYRRALMDEPRGHKDMFGSLWTEPVNPEADFGAIFMDGTGYLPMCGHGSMGSATAAVETGVVEAKEPYTSVKIDAPAGLIEAKVKVEEGKTKSVSIKNVPSFLYQENLKTQVSGKEITYDLAFAGNFVALIAVEQLGIKVEKKDLAAITDIGIKMLARLNKELNVAHPELAINEVGTCNFYERIGSGEVNYRNVVVFGNHQADRSPSGSGTSALMAMLYGKGYLGLNQSFINESIIGSRFESRLLEEVNIGSFTAVVPQITGSSNITGLATYLIDPDDRLKYGFQLN